MSEDVKEIDERVARLVVGVGRNAVVKMTEGLYSMVKFEQEPDKGLQLLGDASVEEKVAYFRKANKVFTDLVTELVRADSDETSNADR